MVGDAWKCLDWLLKELKTWLSQLGRLSLTSQVVQAAEADPCTLIMKHQEVLPSRIDGPVINYK